jgi:glycosyltransferase involved in cell wall biosynthesis
MASAMAGRKTRGKIPVSAVIVTKNEGRRIAACIAALRDFDEIAVVDSASLDDTKTIAAAHGANVFDFEWNGTYPKKRQWSLDNIPFRHDWIFFIDADETPTAGLITEMKNINWDKAAQTTAGFFVRGLYRFDGVLLRHGLRNNKLMLIHRQKMEFPVVDDIGAPGMGEIEGHYQPVLKPGFKGQKIKCLNHFILHDAYDDPAAWQARHERYAAWEAEMDARNAWPREEKLTRRVLKTIFKNLPFRPSIAFIHCFVLKRGFMDGARGFRFAQSRAGYYRMISKASKDRAKRA